MSLRSRRAEAPMMRVAFVAATFALSCLCACGSQPSRAAAVSNATAEPGAPSDRPSTLEPECWLGNDRCVIELDLDGDGRADRVETVREAPCDPKTQASEDSDEADIPDPPCNQGLWIKLATGATQRVGAGVELSAKPSSDPNVEPTPLEADLGGLTLLAISHKDRPGRIRWKTTTGPAPCVGAGLVLSGTDAAAVLCWVGDTAAAYHLGF